MAIRGVSFIGSSVLLAALVACQARDVTEEVGTSASASSHDDLGPLGFRDIFASYLRSTGRTEGDIQTLAYLATPEVIDPAGTTSSSASETLAALDRALGAIRPSDLHSRGERTPFAPARDIDQAIADRGGITFVVLPAELGEMAASAPFQEVFDRAASTAKTEWRDALALAIEADKTDASYSLAALADASTPLGDLVSVASIDHTDGKPLVRVVRMEAPAGSLETLSSLESSSTLYARRLDKVFRVLGGAPTRFYVVGHGRGAAVALDLASHVRSDAALAGWSGKLSGVVSLGGIVFGSPLADVVADGRTTTGKILRHFENLGGALQDCDDADTSEVRTAAVEANVRVWLAAKAEAATLAEALPAHVELGWEALTTAEDTSRLVRRVHRTLAAESLGLEAPSPNYCANVKRYRKLLSGVSTGISAMTTNARHAWWKAHIIPADMKLFALTATMGDASASATSVSPLTTNPIAYNAMSTDMRGFRSDFYDVFNDSAMDLNDGQTPVSRARFWPVLMSQMNPWQPSIRSYFLGTVGTHHGSLALPRTEGTGASPFPREILLKSLARFTVEAQAREP